MSIVNFSPAARRDLDEILDYISVERPGAARSTIERIRATCDRLAAFPRRGELLEVLGPEIRRISVGNYNIYYRPKCDGMLLILRIRHGARLEAEDLIDE